MSKIDDYEYMDKELLIEYEKVVKSKAQKLYIFIKYVFFEIVFLIQCIPRSLRSAYFYFYSHKLKSSACKIHKDIRYSDGRVRNVMDVYEPNRRPQGNPVVIFIHGGAWGFGHKIQYILLGKRLAKHGIVTFIANYTLFPPGKVDNQVEDIAELLNYLKNHIESYGGRLDDVTLIGHSAGAHILMQYLVTIYSKGMGNENLLKIRNYIGLSGPFDISDHFIHESKRGVEHMSPMRPAAGGPAGFKLASPSYLISQLADKSIELPSTYIMHGDIDLTVPLSSSIKLFKLLQQKSTTFCQMLEYENVAHIDIIFLLKDDDNPISKPFLIENGLYVKRDRDSVLSDILQIVYTNNNNNI